MNPLHLDLFLRLLFWPLDWLYLKAGTAAVQALAPVVVWGTLATLAVLTFAGGCCFLLLVLGMVGVVRMHERRGQR